MGRFGNVMLVNGETELAQHAQPGEVVRLYLTNTANTRVFNVALPGARMKLVGGDSGRCEREQFVDSVIIAPSERVVVDVRFETAGETALEHRTPERTYTLATFDVSGESATPSISDAFATLRQNNEWVEERERLADHFAAAPDKTLAFIAEMNLDQPDGPVVFSCPMHPEVVSEEPGSCPHCGMKLLAFGGQRVRLPDAPGDRQQQRRPLPEVRHEAAAGGARRLGSTRRPRPRQSPRSRRRRTRRARRAARRP
jgi:hypothetical protein